MITLRDGNARWFAGAGSLGFDGLDGGHPPLVRAWKMPFRLTGLLDPFRFAVISKTVTMAPVKGNQTNWTFWRCARPLLPLSSRSMVNAVALSNPGLAAFARNYYPRAMRAGIRLILSLHINDLHEARVMGRFVHETMPDLSGIEVNFGCPNLPGHAGSSEPMPVQEQVEHFSDIIDEFQQWGSLPILIKYGYYQPWQAVCKAMDDGRIAANELINAVPWGKHHLGPTSPLSHYGYHGSVSGGDIVAHARQAATDYVVMGLKTPLISGGGMLGHYPVKHFYAPSDIAEESGVGWVSLEEEVSQRLRLGADAVAFSTAFLWDPSAPNRAIRRLESPEDAGVLRVSGSIGSALVKGGVS